MNKESIEQIYKKRGHLSDLYSPFNDYVVFTRQEWERAVIGGMVRYGIHSKLHDLTIFDVGCGSGSTISFFICLGVSASNITGVDLIQGRIDAAATKLPSFVSLFCGDVVSLAIKKRFNLINVSVVFSSILDKQKRTEVAETIWRLLEDNGVVVIYDFVFNNPNNKDVKRLTFNEVRELFPNAEIESAKLTLAPPIGRRLAKKWPLMFHLLKKMSFLRSHRLYWVRKPKN